ncbi:MAG: hypothetical protein FWE28_05450 [Oscillospiraceae bacterium]|nr:hypothetical protein [Oscillospiraceae bacterium]
MANTLGLELFALIEYCKIYDLDIHFFTFGEGVECPDLQSEQYDIGIECTVSFPPNEHGDSGELKATKKNSKAVKAGQLTAFAYCVGSATDPMMLFNTVKGKTKKLNKHYKRFSTNALHIRVSSIFAGSNHFTMTNAKEVANLLSKAPISGEVQFNPIILSQIGDDRDSFCCWIINTDDYSIVEQQGSRVLSKDEVKFVECTVRGSRVV